MQILVVLLVMELHSIKANVKLPVCQNVKMVNVLERVGKVPIVLKANVNQDSFRSQMPLEI